MRLTIRNTLILAGALAASTACAPVHQAIAPPAAAAPDAIRIPFEHYTLPNGLDVILAPAHSIPSVTVDVWYHVGSKNEELGRTGFAHLFEHVMFTGSGHVPYGLHDRLTEGVGGNNNGSTSNDRTNYFQSVPSNYLETMLWLESDRMGFLLETLDSAKFVAQRDIVQNERRQGVENQPYGRAFEIGTAAMYPADHPYSWPVVGYMADLQRASLDDVRAFFRLYYAPNNATLSIVGDFDPARAKELVARYFSDLPPGNPVPRPPVAPVPLDTEQRLVYEDRVQVPRLYFRWPTVGMKEDDQYALNVLGQILAGARTARLTKDLVYDRQSVATVAAFQASREAVGEFFVIVTPRPEHSLTDIEAQADSVIERLQRDGPTTEELAKATAGLEFEFVRSLESNLGKAETLNAGLVFFNDPGYFRTQYERLRTVTAADVQRVASTYLGPNRVVLSIVPLGRPELAASPDASVRVMVSPDGGRYVFGGN